MVLLQGVHTVVARQMGGDVCGGGGGGVAKLLQSSDS